MRGIIIGAGRGQRLMPTTKDAPKCFAEIGGRRILDWILDALSGGGVDEVCFVGGYLIETVRAHYPELTFVHNERWQDNNILGSLMCAEHLMDGPFVCSYADILFTRDIVRALVQSDDDVTLALDTRFMDRYRHRTEHPVDDAEKATVGAGAITRIHRDIDPDAAHGEYIGVGRFSRRGARLLREHYQDCRRAHAGRPFREAQSFEKAYLIHLLQEMIERGVRMAHVDTPGDYWEIDTQQDFEMARRAWGSGR